MNVNQNLKEMKDKYGKRSQGDDQKLWPHVMKVEFVN